MTSPVIRKMSAADLGDVLEIEAVSFSPPWSEGAFRAEMQNPASGCLVVETAKVIVGYICYRCVQDEAELLKLAVHPGHRRHGIATMLIEYAVDELKTRGVAGIYLEVRESNGPARSMYEAFGFLNAGKRREYYSSPTEDAVVMKLALN